MSFFGMRIWGLSILTQEGILNGLLGYLVPFDTLNLSASETIALSRSEIVSSVKIITLMVLDLQTYASVKSNDLDGAELSIFF